MDPLRKYLLTIILIILQISNGFWSLRDVSFKAAKAIRVGDPLILQCDYDLEGAALYSIKWYFGNDEFYRFVPKESPPTRVFPLPGFIVDVSLSNDRKVILRNVQRNLTGDYTCEVSADAPLFHTDIKSGLVIVAEQPNGLPIITTDKIKYALGDPIKANCTSLKAYPAVDITWYINDKQVNNSAFVKIRRNSNKDISGLETSYSIMELLDSSRFTRNGLLNIACRVNQFDLYSQISHIDRETEKPQLAHLIPNTENTRNSGIRWSLRFTWLILILIVIIR